MGTHFLSTQTSVPEQSDDSSHTLPESAGVLPPLLQAENAAAAQSARAERLTRSMRCPLPVVSREGAVGSPARQYDSDPMAARSATDFSQRGMRFRLRSFRMLVA